MKNRDLTGHLFCPHDLTHNSEFRDDLPTLLGSTTVQNNEDEFKTKLKLSKRSALSVFDTPNSSDVSYLTRKVQRFTESATCPPAEQFIKLDRRKNENVMKF